MANIETVEGLIDISNRYSHLAYNRFMALLMYRRDEILHGSQQRLVKGLEQFGTDMFLWRNQKCITNAMEEAEDGVNYFIPVELRHRGELK